MSEVARPGGLRCVGPSVLNVLGCGCDRSLVDRNERRKTQQRIRSLWRFEKPNSPNRNQDNMREGITSSIDQNGLSKRAKFVGRRILPRCDGVELGIRIP
jgi:hypothetical protein